jgi:DNA-binding response OmpR family regulator
MSLHSGARILVVEDEILVTMLIEDALLANGWEVVGPATSIAQAKKFIVSEHFDCAVLDVNLNGQRTFELAKQLLERDTPFVFSTGYGAAGIPDELAALPVLAKPFHERQLVEAVTSLLSRPAEGRAAG